MNGTTLHWHLFVEGVTYNFQVIIRLSQLGVNADNVSVQAAGDDEDSLLGFDLRSDGSGHKWVPFPFKCHVIVNLFLACLSCSLSWFLYPHPFIPLVGVVNLRR